MPEIIFLCGFSGSGKTETGEILAQKMNYEYTDTDKTVEMVMGKSIPEIFSQMGEAKFRFAEWDVVRMATKRKPQVIALGGGTISDEHNLEYIKGMGCLVYLKTTVETIYQRLQNSHMRPMLQKYGKSEEEQKELILTRIKELMAAREGYYCQADITVDTEGKKPEDVAEEIKNVLNEE